MADNYFIKGIKQAIRTSIKSNVLGKEDCYKHYKILGITFRNNNNGASKYDVLIKHRNDSSDCDLSAFEVVVFEDGGMFAYYNGNGWSHKDSEGIHLYNIGMYYGSWTKETATAWLKSIEKTINEGVRA